jgi:hypothetical protein
VEVFTEEMIISVLHVARAFSAQPTLGDLLGDGVIVHELPLADALAGSGSTDVIWLSDADPQVLSCLRLRYPGAAVLVSLGRQGSAADVVTLLELGADLVLRDEGVVLAAAGVQALARRRGRERIVTG